MPPHSTWRCHPPVLIPRSPSCEKPLIRVLHSPRAESHRRGLPSIAATCKHPTHRTSHWLFAAAHLTPPPPPPNRFVQGTDSEAPCLHQKMKSATEFVPPRCGAPSCAALFLFRLLGLCQTSLMAYPFHRTNLQPHPPLVTPSRCPTLHPPHRQVMRVSFRRQRCSSAAICLTFAPFAPPTGTPRRTPGARWPLRCTLVHHAGAEPRLSWAGTSPWATMASARPGRAGSHARGLGQFWLWGCVFLFLFFQMDLNGFKLSQFAPKFIAKWIEVSKLWNKFCWVDLDLF
jgi:hypothetical protein